MQITIRRFRNFTTTLVICLFGIGFASSANAIAIYDASAQLDFTFDSVIDETGAAIDSGWEVSVGVNTTDIAANVTGGGDATAAISFTADSVAFPLLDTGDMISQDSSSNGSATDGTSASLAVLGLDLTITNLTNGDLGIDSVGELTFNFSYSYLLSALVSGSSADGDIAEANAFIDIIDELGLYILQEGALTDLGNPTSSGSGTGSFMVTVPGGQSATITTFTDTNGRAEATPPAAVPEPTTLALLSLGLAGLGFSRRRMKA